MLVLPSAKRPLVHTKSPGERSLGQAHLASSSAESLSKRSRTACGVVAEEPDDRWIEVNSGLGVSFLPVDHGRLADVEPSRHVLLTQSQIAPSRPEVIAQVQQFLRALRKFHRLQGQPTEWQEGNAALDAARCRRLES